MTDSQPVIIRAATQADAGDIATIYNHYVTQTVITFEEEPVSPLEMSRRIAEVAASSLPWLVAEEHGQVIGYAYASRWKARSAYRFSVEITVYVTHQEARRGIGSKLYGELFAILQARGVHAVMGVIALPNEASVALHERFGLRKVAHLQEVGFKHGRWLDVGYWQRTLEAG